MRNFSESAFQWQIVKKEADAKCSDKNKKW